MSKLKIGKKSGLKYFDIKDIRSWGPCYDPSRHLPEDFKGTAIDILRNEAIMFEDRLWVVCRNEITSDRVMRLFAVWSYRQTLTYVTRQDPRSLEAANIAEKYALGQANYEELSAAWIAAWTAARSAAWSADVVADSASEAAARSAESAAESAAELAAWSAWSASRLAARSAAWSVDATAESAQRDRLIEMLIAEGKERIAKKERLK